MTSVNAQRVIAHVAASGCQTGGLFNLDERGRWIFEPLNLVVSSEDHRAVIEHFAAGGHHGH